MRKITSIAAALALAASALTFSAPAARADADDAVIAGAAGFALGTFFGHATARPYHRAGYRVHYRHPHVYHPHVYRPHVYHPRVHVRRPVVRVYRPWTRAWFHHCAAKYRSFNRHTGYYVTFGGHRRFCY